MTEAAIPSIEHSRVLDAVGSKVNAPRKKVRVNCPLCADRGKPSLDRDRSMAFYPASGFYKCFRCRAMGVVDGVGTVQVTTPLDGRPCMELEGVAYLRNEDTRRSMHAAPAMQYLRKRKIPERVWSEANLAVGVTGEFANRIVVPLVGTDGKLWGAVGRAWERDPLPYRTMEGMQRDRLFNDAALDVATRRPVLVVEGIFDALPFYPHAVACLGKPSPPQVDRLAASRRPIVVCLDGDAWRDAEVLMLKLRLRGVEVEFLRLPGGTDPNDLDPEDLTAQAANLIEGENQT